MASARFAGSPEIPLPVIRMAPNPSRAMGRSFPITNSPLLCWCVFLHHALISIALGRAAILSRYFALASDYQLDEEPELPRT